MSSEIKHVHRMYYHFSEYPKSLRVLYTSALLVLGLAYIFAMIQTYVSHAARDGQPGLSINDLIIAYSGNKNNSRLEAALKGPMKDMVNPEDSAKISDWIHKGSDQTTYTNTIQPILEDNCVACHDGSSPHRPNLTDPKVLEELTAVDTGASIYTLVRVSHIHLFGLTFIFFIMGQVFSHALVRPVWFKCTVVAVPFVAIVLDIGSWYLTKLNPNFAWIIYVGGIGMGLSFTYMWFVSIYQMWFMTPPDDLIHDID
ncbi:MAG: hypothetical protein JKY92_01570 [Magnetovibrio sp.]|nr:hypothetical protein [Magnetovibrio sp.]